MLILPLILFLVGFKDPKPSSENKALASLPDFTIKKLDPFPEAFDAWFNDHFVFRNSLVATYNKLFIHEFHFSPKPKLVGLGKENWIFLMNNEVNNFRGKMPVFNYIFNRSIEEINWRYDTCKALGAEFVLVILPSKPTVYSEYLPDYISKAADSTFTERFIGRVVPKLKCSFIDLRPALINAKKSKKVFYKSDNHWNNNGAFVAYKALIDSLNAKGYDLSGLPITDCITSDSVFAAGNISRMIDMELEFKEEELFIFPNKKKYLQERAKSNYPCPEGFPYCWTYEEVRQGMDTTKPNLLVFRESFTNDLLMDLLGSSFNRSTFIFDSWKHQLDLSIVANEKPDLVICMVMEGFLDCFSNFPSKPDKRFQRISEQR